MYALCNIKLRISCQGEKCTFYASKVKTWSMRCTYSMQKDQRRTSNVMCIFYATTRISIVQDAFMQYMWWYDVCYKKCRAWCLGNVINKQSGYLDNTSWGEWRWIALLWWGSPLVFLELLPCVLRTLSFNSQYKGSDMLSRIHHVEHFGCRLSSWPYSQLSLFSNGVTD